MQTLLDTARLNDALACGHRAPTDYSDGGLRVSFYQCEKLGPVVRINGMEGEIETTGFEELDALISALQRARSLTAAKSVQVAEAA